MTVVLRPAKEADAPLLLAWRNDPATRANSRRQHELTWAELIEAPPGTTRETFVALEDGQPVGTARLDRSGEECELSWTVAPGERRRGLGRAIVAAAIDAAPPGRLVAMIRPGNEPSRRIAAALGFKEGADRDGLLVWRLTK